MTSNAALTENVAMPAQRRQRISSIPEVDCRLYFLYVLNAWNDWNGLND